MSYKAVDVIEIRAETDKAFLVVVDGNREVWVPKSLVEDPDEHEKGDEDCELSIAEWFCSKEDL